MSILGHEKSLQAKSGETAMSIKLNHTIVSARNKKESATFLTEILGLPPPKPFGD